MLVSFSWLATKASGADLIFAAEVGPVFFGSRRAGLAWLKVHNGMNKNIDDLRPTVDIESVSKLLPIAATAVAAGTVLLSVFGYSALLAYTSVYSIHFPYSFFPYLVVFGIIIVSIATMISIFAFSPSVLQTFSMPKEQYQQLLEIGANGGLVRWRKIPQSARFL